MTEPLDPFDQLAAGTDERIDPIFAARLRARVRRALGATPGGIAIELPARTQIRPTSPRRRSPPSPPNQTGAPP
jgi:hypothetical protein